MAKLSHRIFAFTMAALFLFTAIGFAAFVISDIAKSRETQKSEADVASAQAAEAKCNIAEPVTGVGTLPAPEPYTVGETVKELKTETLSEGSGEAAKNGDCVVMKYYGTLAKDGTMFDENFSKDQALQLPLGGGRVIQGWEQGLVGIKVGETRRLVIPSSLAYGENGQGSIPPNSDLVFVVKLDRIKK